MEKIKKIISETFQIKESSITSQTNMQDIDSWDSLTHMELIVSLEDEFSIEFTADEIMAMTDVEKIEKVVGEKVNGN
ncbi:acyl carrier protein [Lachnospiraceae bacterium A4]|nr:acyl carrier protein [Lachnospiraceae bacterium A4]